MKTHDVNVVRGDQWWVLCVPAIRAAISQAKTLRAVEPTARDLISLMLEVTADSFGVAIQLVLPEQVQTHVQRAEELRKQSARAKADAAAEMRAAAAGVTAAGMTLRDIGAALGMSYQRSHELVTEAA